jgi:flagellar hook assembly protein FlgD
MRKVRTLVDERKEVGDYRITWDGRDDSGDDLPTGVYFARISQWGEPRLSSKRKLVLLR